MAWRAATTAHGGRVKQHAASPAENVELGDETAHQAHAVALFHFWHGQCHVKCGGALVSIVGIDDQCLGQFPCRTGELGQNEDAALVIACRDKFLGDQVHAVMQAADKAQIRGTKILIDQFGLRGVRS
jgi:hypothetical protein